MAEENIRKTIELDPEVHQELMLYKVKQGHKNVSEAVKDLLQKVSR